MDVNIAIMTDRKYPTEDVQDQSQQVRDCKYITVAHSDGGGRLKVN